MFTEDTTTVVKHVLAYKKKKNSVLLKAGPYPRAANSNSHETSLYIWMRPGNKGILEIYYTWHNRLEETTVK